MSQINLTPQSDKKLAIVYTTYALPDAHIVAGRLKAEGIPALIDHMPGMSSIGVSVGALGEIRVLVYTEHYEQALDILEPPSPDEMLLDNDNIIIFDDKDDYDE